MIEVKNLRSWLYPNAAEVFQLLDKALRLQQTNPELPLVPILIRRRAHNTLYWMGHQLGFVTIPMNTQFVGDVDSDALDEVRVGLHFDDLRIGTGPSLRIRDRLNSERLHAALPRIADAWLATASNPAMASVISSIRGAGTTPERLRRVDELRVAASAYGHQGGGTCCAGPSPQDQCRSSTSVVRVRPSATLAGHRSGLGLNCRWPPEPRRCPMGRCRPGSDPRDARWSARSTLSSRGRA